MPVELAQTVSGPVIDDGAAGGYFSVTAKGAVVTAQVPLLTVAVYEPVFETLIDEVVALLLQLYKNPEGLAVSTSLEPLQNVESPVMAWFAGTTLLQLCIKTSVASAL